MVTNSRKIKNIKGNKLPVIQLQCWYGREINGEMTKQHQKKNNNYFRRVQTNMENIDTHIVFQAQYQR